MHDYPIIDADSHLSEDLSRLAELTDARYRHYAPRMIDQGTSELFYIGGVYMPQPPGMSWGETITPGAYRARNRTPKNLPREILWALTQMRGSPRWTSAAWPRSVSRAGFRPIT